MDQSIEVYLKYLELPLLSQQWDNYLKDATAKKISYQHLLTTVIQLSLIHISEPTRRS